MKASELRAKSADELNQELQSLLRAQFNLRMQKATQQLTNTSQIRKVRRDIARVRTAAQPESEERMSEANREASGQNKRTPPGASSATRWRRP